MFTDKLKDLLGAFDAYRAPPKKKRRPLSRDLKNPNNLVQAERIATAQYKRERKARKLQRDTVRAVMRSRTINCVPGVLVPRSLNPFYIAK